MQSRKFWTSATTDGSSREASPRHILIVSRDHPGLFEYVRARFADEENVEVVLDRRRGRDRRRRASHQIVDRRRAERRIHSYIDAARQMESMQFVTIAASTIEMRVATAGGATAV